MAKNYNRSNYRSNFRRVLDILVACVFLLAFAFGTAFITQYNEQGHFGPFIAVDGDTLLEGGNRLRLEGLDAPEYRQKCTINAKTWNCGIEARNFLRAQLNSSVRCTAYGVDKYDRALVQCFDGTKDINAALVRNGFAVAYGAYYSEQRQAKREKLGIWRGSFELPQEWRENRKYSALNGSNLEPLEGVTFKRMAGIVREFYLWVCFW